jgi:hypothetical protein
MMSVAAPLSIGTIGLPVQCCAMLRNLHRAQFTHFFAQVHFSQTRISVLDPVCPTRAYSPARTMV